MAVDVTFLQRLVRRPSTGALAGHPVSLTPAASYSLRLGPATVAQMLCHLDAAGYWKTSGTTVFQTSNFVTCQDTWWSFLKTSMDLGVLAFHCFVVAFLLNEDCVIVERQLTFFSALCSNLLHLGLSSRS